LFQHLPRPGEIQGGVFFCKKKMIHSCFHRVNTDDNLSACAAINTP